MGMRAVNPYGRAHWFVHVYRPVVWNRWPMQWEYRWEEDRLPFRPCGEEERDGDYRLLEGEPGDGLYPQNLPAALEAIKRDAVKGATCSHLLYLDGMDQAHPCPSTPRIVELANGLHTGDTFLHDSFHDYVQAVKAEARDLEVKRGEFRHPMVDGLWQNLYPGMLSARIYLKQQNRSCEANLQKNADTWAALAALLGMEHPAGLLDLAWKHLLASQAHDSIAGCSVDLVHEDVECRNRQVLHLAAAVNARSQACIVRHIDGSRFPPGSVCLVAFNPTQFTRDEVVTALVDLPAEARAAGLLAEDEEGREVPVQVLGSRPATPIVSSPYDFPVLFKTRRFHCALQLSGVPGVGYRTVLLKPRPGLRRERGTLSARANTLENELLRVEIGGDGRLDLLDKRTGREYPGLHVFEDRSEVGDHGTSRCAQQDETITSIGRPARIAKVLDGALLARYRLESTLMLPRDASPDGSRRNPERVPFLLTSHLTLRKDSPFLEIRTSLDNRVRDHRLRVLFPSGLTKGSHSYSETHFAVTRREIRLPDTSTWAEPMLPFHPQHMFCGIEDEKGGLAVLNIGLPEYAVHDDPGRTIGLTLLRTYRYPVIGADPEEATTDESQQGCQCLRPFTFDYALYPYAGDWETGEVFRQACRFNLPLRLNQTGRGRGTLPPSLAFLGLEPQALVLSAVKASARPRGADHPALQPDGTDDRRPAHAVPPGARGDPRRPGRAAARPGRASGKRGPPERREGPDRHRGGAAGRVFTERPITSFERIVIGRSAWRWCSMRSTRVWAARSAICSSGCST